jgi:zinc protease
MESDRMGHLLPALTQAKLDNQRDVVLNERRQNYENRPYGLASIATLASLFPPDHPYHWPTIGFPDDLRAASLADVRSFFERYYHPGNASLAMAGDVGVGEALDLARRYFEPIPAGPPVPPPGSVPARDAPVRIVLEDRVEMPRVYFAWPSDRAFGPDDAPLDLAAEILANGKTARLYRPLVYERRIATDVAAAQNSRELAGFFQIVATASPGSSLEAIEATAIEELRRLADTGPEDGELERVRTLAEASFVYRLQTVGGFGGISDQLNAYNTLCRDPGYFDRDLARYRDATPGDVRRVVSRLLGGPPVVALSVVPRGRPELALPGSVPLSVS